MFKLVFEVSFEFLFSAKKEIKTKTTEKNKQIKPITIPGLFKRNSASTLSTKKTNLASILKPYLKRFSLFRTGWTSPKNKNF